MRTLFNQPNVDKSSPSAYPSGRVKDNDGSGNGTGVNEATKGDLHQFFEKLMRLYDIAPNDLPDNEVNGFQLIDALRGVASKNDFIYPLSTDGTILSVNIKLTQMLENEYITCLAAFNKSTETQIKGSGPSTFAITYNGNFKANEYVRVIKTSTGVSIIRVADALSIDAMVTDASFLKKASQLEENAGSIDTVATTPLVNKVVYTLRTIGADSINYLATAARNGLYPKEHFSIVSGIGSNPVRNIGSFSGLDPGDGSVGQTYPVTGDVVSATLTNRDNSGSTVRVVLDNTMTNSDYYVRAFIQSLSSNIDQDDDIGCPVFKQINATTFDIRIGEYRSQGQLLKVFIEAVKI